VGADDNVVRMDSHTFTIPPDRGWVCQEQSGPQHTYLHFEDGQVLYLAGVFFWPVEDPAIRAYAADELAALYFGSLEQRVLSAEDEHYEIRGSVTGTEEIGGSLFHTHSFTTVGEGFVGQTFAYLRIPFPRDNVGLVAVEFRQASPHDPPLDADPSRLEDARAIAASLSVDEASLDR
jgi:hypothetical protein